MSRNISDKLDYLDGTKQAIKQSLINKGQNVQEDDTFRSYASYIDNLYPEIDPEHRLPSDLVTDADQTNKFVSAAEKAQINTNKNDILLRSLITETGNKIDLEINSSTYVLTAKLYDKNNTLLSTSSGIDLPLETMVVGASYDSQTQEIVLTLKNGETVRFSVAALVSGLQPEITSQNKLDSDLVDDTNSSNKFVTTSEKNTWNNKAEISDIPDELKDLSDDSTHRLVSDTEKSTWNNKYAKPAGGIPKTDLSSTVQSSLEKADSALQTEIDPVFNSSPAHTITNEDIENWNSKQNELIPGDNIELKTEFEIKGNTEQFTTTGKNLIDTLETNSAIVGSGLTYKREDDGTIQISGTTNRAWDYTLTTSLTFEAGKTYTFSFDNTGTSGNEVIYLLFNSANGGQLSLNDTYKSKTITIVENQTLAVKWSKASATSVQIKMKIQIEQGSTATSYEPYTGGTASPNPDYPQDIKVVTGENTVKVVNKNLLPNNWSSGSISGSTGGIVSYPSRVYTTNKIKLNGNTVYYLKLYNKSDYSIRCAVDEYDKNNTHLGRIGGTDGSVNGAFTTKQDTSYINITMIETTEQITYSIYQSYLTNGTLELQLEEGSTVTSYEEHKEQSLPLSLQSRNLFDKNTVTANARIGMNGSIITDSSASGYSLSDYIPCKPNTSYTGNTVFTNAYNRIAYYDKDKTLLSLNDGGDINTITTPDNCIYMRFAKETTQLDTFILVEGSIVPTSYQPYYHYELCKIGDYQDYIYKNDNKWYIKKLINRVVIKGLENWLYAGIPSVFYTTSITDYAINNNIPFSNYYKGVTNVNGAGTIGTMPNNIIGFINQSGTVTPRLYIKDTRYVEDSSDLETWLSTHNIDLYYVLETPTDIEITDTTLISQLEDLSKALSNQWIKHISQTNEELPFDLFYNKQVNISANLSDYVKNTDYATSSKAGIVRLNTASYGTEIDSSNGMIRGVTRTYEQYQNSLYPSGFISKGTLENVITGKGLVSNTDYATASVGGVFKKSNSYATDISSGFLACVVKAYSDYISGGNYMFVSKGTLENVITGKELTNKTYVDGLVGDIESALEELDIGGGVQ